MTARVLAVTGAAAGIGRAVALDFIRRGWRVGAYDVDQAGLESLAAEAGDGLVTGSLDVTDAAAFRTTLAALAEENGRLDVLVNNAGLLRAGRFEEIDVAAHEQEVAVNVTGVLHGLHAAFPHLRETASRHGGSTVVNLGSASAIYGQAELANYSATKFYVRGLTEALDLEWDRYGIRVVDLWPLFVDTGMLAGVRTGTTDSLGVRLTPDDVVAAIRSAVEPTRVSRLLHQVHYPVGRQSSSLTLGSRFSPAWLTRLVNKRFAHQ